MALVVARGFRSLPQELVDHIIDFLHDDLPTLHTCSLVCRGWLPASSFHLFTNLRWPPCAHQWNLRSEQCKCHLHSDDDTLQRPYELCAGSARIRENVQGLRISMEWWTSPTDTTPITKMTTFEELLGLLDLLPRLQTLEARHLNFADTDQQVPLPVQRRSVRSVKIVVSSSDHHFEHTIDLLSHFSQIYSLYVDGGNYEAQSLRPPTPLRQIRADTFAILCRGSRTNSIGVQALFQHTDLNAVRSLSILEAGIRAGTEATNFVLQGAIRRCAHLRSLTCGDGSLERALAHPTPIPTLHELRTHTGRSSRFMEHWAQVVSLARSPLASTVRTLAVSMEYSHTILESDAAFRAHFRADVESVDWPAVNLALAALPALRVLDVLVEMEMHYLNDFMLGIDLTADRLRSRDTRRRDREDFRVMTEDAIQVGLFLATNQTLELSVSIRNY